MWSSKSSFHSANNSSEPNWWKLVFFGRYCLLSQEKSNLEGFKIAFIYWERPTDVAPVLIMTYFSLLLVAIYYERKIFNSVGGLFFLRDVALCEWTVVQFFHVNIFRHIHNMGGKSSAQGEIFFPMFANCVHVCLPDDCHLRSCSVKNLKTLKCSSGFLKCSFDNPAENVCFDFFFFFQNRLRWQIFGRMRINWF